MTPEMKLPRIHMKERRDLAAYSSPFGHSFQWHSAGRSERSDAGWLEVTQSDPDRSMVGTADPVVSDVFLSVTA